MEKKSYKIEGGRIVPSGMSDSETRDAISVAAREHPFFKRLRGVKKKASNKAGTAVSEGYGIWVSSLYTDNNVAVVECRDRYYSVPYRIVGKEAELIGSTFAELVRETDWRAKS